MTGSNSSSHRFAGLAFLLLAALVRTALAQPAELIVSNAKIATLDERWSTAQAMAVRDGKIIALGPDAAILALAGPHTRKIDAGGRTVVPGLIDSHMHAIRAALSFSTEVNWIGARTIAEALERMREAARNARPGAWLVVAGGWTEQQFAEKRRPTLAELTAAAPDNPVYVQLFYSSLLLTPRARAALNMPPEADPPPRMSIDTMPGVCPPAGWAATSSASPRNSTNCPARLSRTTWPARASFSAN